MGGTSGATTGTSGATTGTAGTGTTGGSGGSGGSGTTIKPPTGTQLNGASAYTIFTTTDAPAGAAAPAKYASLCSACHQAGGEGFRSLAPEIRHVPADYAKWVIRNGRTGTSMLPFPATDPKPENALSDAELTEIVTWLESLPKPTTGQLLYQDFCGNCHGPTMPSGGAVPYKVSGLPNMAVAATVRAGVGADPAVRNGYMPKFDATVLTDAELGLIQTFIGSL
jgi:mono/diheme cytochrome c family protein